MKKSLISTKAFGTALAIILSQVLPPGPGYPVSRFIAWLISLFPNGSAYQSLKLNQWIVSGKTMNERELNWAVRKIFRNQSYALYDFYRTLNRPEEVHTRVNFSPKFLKLIEECKKEDQPTMLLMPHLTGFNIGGIRLAQEGMRYLTLSFPNPTSGYQWQNKLRNDRGMEVVPFTVEALGLARERLQAGGTVLTGIDRPLDETRHHPKFFGYPTNLPVAYVRLALKTNARVYVVGFMTLEDHNLLVDVSDPITLEEHGDPDQELVLNAEKVLRVAEDFIRQDPTQWMMFFPVWPDELENLKKRTR